MLLPCSVTLCMVSRCDNQPASSLLLGDELPQSTRDILQVKRISLCKVSTQRKFVGENNSSRHFSRPYQTSRSSGPLNFTRRSDRRHPWSRPSSNIPFQCGPVTSELSNTSASTAAQVGARLRLFACNWRKLTTDP